MELARWEALLGRVRAMLAPSSTGGEYVEVEGEVPLAMGVMFRDLLGQHGIPAMLRDSGVGRGAMGGAPNLVRIMVPMVYADEARWWLAPENGLPSPDAPSGELSQNGSGDQGGDQGGGDEEVGGRP